MGALDRALAYFQRAFSNPINLPGFYTTSLWRVPPGKKLEDYLAAFGQVGWLFATVSKISESVSQTPWRIMRTSPDDGEEGIEVPKTHPASELLRRVNPFWTSYDLFQFTSMYMDLVGEAFWYFIRDGSGRPVMVWTLQPHRMYVVPSDNLAEFVSGYVYRSPLGIDIPLSVKDIIHFKRPNPLNMYRGLGPVQAAQFDIDAENFTAQYMRNYFFNSAAPGGFIKVPGGYDREQHERLIEMFEKRHQGAQAGGRIGILWGDMEWTAAEVTARELQLIQVRKLNRDQILGVFGVPLSVMGIVENVNRANAEAGYYVYGKEVIDPRLRRQKSVIDEFFLPMFGTNLEWTYDDPVPEDTLTNRQMAIAGYASGVISHGESRQAWGDVDELDEEDFYLLPFAGQPTPLTGLDDLGEEKKPALPPPDDDDEDKPDDDDDADDKDDDKKPVPSQDKGVTLVVPKYTQYIRVPAKKKPKRKPVPSYAFEVIDAPSHVLEITDFQSRALPAPSREDKEAHDEWGERVWQQVQGLLGTEEDKYSSELHSEFDRLAEEIGKRLEGMIAFPKQRAIDEILADWLSHDKTIEIIVRRASAAGFGAGARVAANVLGVSFDLRRLQSELWAAANAGMKIKGITETTRKNVAQAVEEALRKGITSKALADNVKTVMKLSGAGRAMTIARTELQQAAAEGSDRQYAQEEIEKKEWYTARDERVCPICLPLHGEVVRVGEQFPGRHKNPPAHPNCRCAILPLVEFIPCGEAYKYSRAEVGGNGKDICWKQTSGPLPGDEDPFDVGERGRISAIQEGEKIGVGLHNLENENTYNKWSAEQTAKLKQALGEVLANQLKDSVSTYAHGPQHSLGRPTVKESVWKGVAQGMSEAASGKKNEYSALMGKYATVMRERMLQITGGNETITLYRGMYGKRWNSFLQKQVAAGKSEFDVGFGKWRASSWTIDPDVASQFAEGGTIVEAVFLIDDVLMSPMVNPTWPRTNVYQREFVMRHGPEKRVRIRKSVP